MTKPRSPWRKAFDEARFIVLGALIVAIAYNVFAESRVPWIRVMPGSGDTVSTADLLSDLDTASAVPTDTVVAIDTTSAIDTTTVTDTASINAADRAKAIEDSLKAVRAAREAFVRDSIAKATATSSSEIPDNK